MFDKIVKIGVNFLRSLKDGYQYMIEDDKRQSNCYMVSEESKGAVLQLKKLEYKHLACFPADKDFNEQNWNNLISKVQDEDFKFLVLRTLNYQEDGGSVLEFGIEHSIQNRNELMEYVLFKYLDHFKHLILAMDKIEQEQFFNKLKDVQEPRILVESVVKYEEAINKSQKEQ